MSSGQKLQSFNPATGELVGEVPVSSSAEISDMVVAARAASTQWRQTDIRSRAEMLVQAGRDLSEESRSIGELLSREMGKPLKNAVGEVRYCASGMADKVENIIAALQPVVTSDNLVETVISYQALGVVAAISPWNFPVMMPNKMIIPALMAGNTVVIKPSEETPLAAQAYVDVLNRYLPENVLQIAHGARDQGKALVDSDVNLVSFTGSRAAGVQIMKSCADGLKRIVLELGGKDPLIVLADADIDKAAAYAVENSFDNAGQQCISTERVFVHEEIAEQFEQKVVEIAAKVKQGGWDQADVDMGPMIHNRQRQLVIDQIEQAIASGARVLLGGKDHMPGYVTPTVLADVRHEMTIASEETFGPVVSITRYTDIEDALQQANDTPYGLGAAVFGGDTEVAEAVAARIEAGMVGINRSIFALGDAPWVGAKQSGFGYNGSPDGYRQFTQVRVTSKALG